MMHDDRADAWTNLFNRLDAEQRLSEHRICAGIPGCEFVESAPAIQRILTWGILNPFGPTVESLCVVTDPSKTREVLFGKMSNPFQSWNRAYAAFPWNATSCDLLSLLQALFSVTQPAVETTTFIVKPTFVFPEETIRISREVIADLVHTGLKTAKQLDFGQAVTGMKRFWLKPWDRLDGESRALQTQSESEPPEVTFRDWWCLVSDLDHVCAELRAIMQAWEGAIEFAKKSPLADSATHVTEGLAFHMRLIEQTDVEST